MSKFNKFGYVTLTKQNNPKLGKLTNLIFLVMGSNFLLN